LGDDCVAFEVASSTTHLIEQPAGLLLEWASSDPISLLQLSEKLLEMVIVEHREEVFPYVVNSVRNFVSMGLLEIKEIAA
jgi:hypothetical protein